MKVSKNKLIALFTDFGMKGSDKWSDEKILKTLPKVVRDWEHADLSQENIDLVAEISKAVKKNLIEIDDAPPEEEGEDITPDDVTKMTKKELVDLIKEFDLEVVASRHKKIEALRQAVIDVLFADPEEQDEEDPEDPEKAEEPAKGKVEKATAPSPVIRDSFGSRPGTIAAKVNAVLSEEWVSEEDIAENSGLPLQSARDRLYYMVQEGWVEKETIRRFRVTGKLPR